MSTRSRTLLLQLGVAAGGVLCALAAIEIIHRVSVHFTVPTAPAGYAADRRGPTTVYAPTAAAARQGQEEVQYARTRFHALFGTEAPGLVVVLVEEPRHLQRIDLHRLQRGHRLLLPFLTPAALSASPGTGMLDRAEGGEADRKLLAHEACHGYVAVLADELARRPRVRGAPYGHPALADWFEEAVAVLCESEEGRTARRGYFRNRLDRRLPLAAFTRMPHPLAGMPGIDNTPGQASIEILTAAQIHDVLPHSDPMLFYAQALSLGEFMEDRAGAGGMRIVATALVETADLAEALREVRRRVPGLPGTVESLEAEWIQWVVDGRG
jgi:hypothetical protein